MDQRLQRLLSVGVALATMLDSYVDQDEDAAQRRPRIHRALSTPEDEASIGIHRLVKRSLLEAGRSATASGMFCSSPA